MKIVGFLVVKSRQCWYKVGAGLVYNLIEVDTMCIRMKCGLLFLEVPLKDLKDVFISNSYQKREYFQTWADCSNCASEAFNKRKKSMRAYFESKVWCKHGIRHVTKTYSVILMMTDLMMNNCSELFPVAEIQNLDVRTEAVKFMEGKLCY